MRARIVCPMSITKQRCLVHSGWWVRMVSDWLEGWDKAAVSIRERVPLLLPVCSRRLWQNKAGNSEVLTHSLSQKELPEDTASLQWALPTTCGLRQTFYIYSKIDNQPCINLAPCFPVASTPTCQDLGEAKQSGPHTRFQGTALPCCCSVLAHGNTRSHVLDHRNLTKDIFKPVF